MLDEQEGCMLMRTSKQDGGFAVVPLAKARVCSRAIGKGQSLRSCRWQWPKSAVVPLAGAKVCGCAIGKGQSLFSTQSLVQQG